MVLAGNVGVVFSLGFFNFLLNNYFRIVLGGESNIFYNMKSQQNFKLFLLKKVCGG